MRLLLFDDHRVGVLRAGQVVDASGAVPEAMAETDPQRRMVRVIEDFERLRPELQRLGDSGGGLPLTDVRIRPPLPSPTNVLCAASNYDDRVPGFVVKPLDFFYKGGRSVSGPGDVVELPDLDEVTVFHAEPELGCVIGKRARHVTDEEGLGYVFGYLNFVDVSARGFPAERGTFLRKGQEGWAPTGPVIVTADEIPDPQAVRVRQWINDELCQDFTTAEMITPVGGLIAWVSRFITLLPGDLIGTGTNHQGLSPVNDGDAVRMQLDELEPLDITIKSDGPRKTEYWRPAGIRP